MHTEAAFLILAHRHTRGTCHLATPTGGHPGHDDPSQSVRRRQTPRLHADRDRRGHRDPRDRLGRGRAAEATEPARRREQRERRGDRLGRAQRDPGRPHAQRRRGHRRLPRHARPGGDRTGQPVQPAVRGCDPRRDPRRPLAQGGRPQLHLRPQRPAVQLQRPHGGVLAHRGRGRGTRSRSGHRRRQRAADQSAAQLAAAVVAPAGQRQPGSTGPDPIGRPGPHAR